MSRTLKIKTGKREWTVDSVERKTESRSCFSEMLLHVTYIVTISSPCVWSKDGSRETHKLYFTGQANCVSEPRRDGLSMGSNDSETPWHKKIAGERYRDGRSYGPTYALRAKFDLEIGFAGDERIDGDRSRVALTRALTRKIGATIKARNLSEVTPCEAMQLERALESLKVSIERDRIAYRNILTAGDDAGAGES